jgi:heat shock protein HslJ
MKKIMMVLPLAVLLAYCSGPNNTQTTEETDMDANSSSVTASTTTSTDATVSDADVSVTTDVSDVNTNTTTVAVQHNADIDMTDPMVQHFERVNAGNWTWDMNYPGYDRPVAGSYNTAANGNWQLVMTPELVSAWKQDNSRSLWASGYAYNGTYLGGNTYLSASESFNTRSSGTSGLNNNASTNSSITTDMNGNTSSTTLNGTTSVLDVNSISYNAANGNMYQLPKLNLYLDNGTFTAYTGCNAISGRVQVSGNSLHFLNTTPSTNIDCLGGLDQGVLLDLLSRVDSYAYVNDELQLLQGNQVLLKLNKSNVTGLQ